MDWLTALTTLAPSIIAALTLIFAYLQSKDNLKNQSKLQQAQWDREKERDQNAYEQKRNESALAENARIKERLIDVYANGIQALSVLVDAYDMSLNKDKVELLKNTQTALARIAIEHFNKSTNEYNGFVSECNDLIQNDEVSRDAVDNLRNYIITFTKEDPRLK